MIVFIITIFFSSIHVQAEEVTNTLHLRQSLFNKLNEQQQIRVENTIEKPKKHKHNKHNNNNNGDSWENNGINPNGLTGDGIFDVDPDSGDTTTSG
jgi:hypothetical protein